MTNQGNNEDLKTTLAKQGIKMNKKNSPKSDASQPMTSTSGGNVKISNDGNPNSWSSYSGIG
jgi:hypothetical protein